MPRLLEPLWLILATISDKKLGQTIEFLREENRILRSKLPARITITPRERSRLLRYGRKLGTAIASIITIVSPRTFARWKAAEGGKPKRCKRTTGRPRTEESVRDLVLRLARETGWGYSRILGELKKLGVGPVSRSTVINILREAGLDPGPKRGVGSWSEFLTRHAATLWASDFLTVKTWTTRGIVDLSVLFFIHPGTRKVFIGGVSANPDAAWMKQQARNAAMRMEDMGHPVTHLIIDHDGKYVKEYDAIFEAEDAKVQRVGPRAPNLNAYAERFAFTLRRELLDHFCILGEKHLRHLLNEFVTRYYHFERPHQGIDNVPPMADEESATVKFRPAACDAGNGSSGCSRVTTALRLDAELERSRFACCSARSVHVEGPRRLAIRPISVNACPPIAARIRTSLVLLRLRFRLKIAVRTIGQGF